jgi:hypothetical protein
MRLYYNNYIVSQDQEFFFGDAGKVKYLLDNRFIEEPFPNFSFGTSLLTLLKKQPYSKKLSDRKKFKDLVVRLENKTNKISSPGIKILKKNPKACILRKYLITKNTSKKFKINNKNLSTYILNSIKRCKKKELVLFVHIDNYVTGNKHLNLLVINLKTKKITRIDPTSSKTTTITNKKVKKELIPYFKKIGFDFTGYDYRSKIIKHGKLCRFAGPAEYIYGKKLNYNILKKIIVNYFK